jgi:hypothetical protein
MKIFFTILTMLFFSLPSIACDKDDTCCEETETTSVVIPSPHPADSPGQGCCNSLCDCACCVIPVLIPDGAKLPAPKTSLAKIIYYNHNIAPGSEVFYPIWQPPKI